MARDPSSLQCTSPNNRLHDRTSSFLIDLGVFTTLVVKAGRSPGERRLGVSTLPAIYMPHRSVDTFFPRPQSPNLRCKYISINANNCLGN